LFTACLSDGRDFKAARRLDRMQRRMRERQVTSVALGHKV